jgi:signal transduction histidine kinase
MTFQKNSSIFPCLRLSVLLALLVAASPAEAQPLLIKALDVRSLPREEAAKGLPAQISGVVTFIQTDQSFVVQDDTEGIYVTGRKGPFDFSAVGNLRTGTRVEVRGYTGPGGFAPVIHAESVRLLGEAEIPPARTVVLTDLLSGVFDCQRVTLSGVVQRVFPGNEKGVQMRLELATPGGWFSVFVNDSSGLDAASLIDAEVQCTGVGFTLFTPRGELTGVHLRLSDPSGLSVLKPGLSDPFSAPRVPLFALRPYQHQGPSLHRQRLTGTVTLCRPGEFFYVQMAERAVRVNTRQPDSLQPGDLVEASGFVVQSGGFAELSEAVFRRSGRGPLPAPIRATRSQILAVKSLGPSDLRKEDYDGARVRICASLIKVESNPGEDHRLFLDCEDGVVIATLSALTPPARLQHLTPDCEVELTGVCSVRLAAGWPVLTLPVPQSFVLLLHGPEDIHVVHAPSWWTPRRLLTVLAGTLTALALVLLWVWLLQRTVTRQAGRIASEQQAKREAEVEFKATIRERNRLAADLHDTLQQDLTAIAFQMEAAHTLREQRPAQAAEHARLARELLDRSQEDLRRAVWSLRAGVLEGHTFEEALQELVRRTRTHTGIDCICDVESDGTRIREVEANHLLMLAQEALNNALKHASPTRITVRAEIRRSGLQLTFSDDGCGFTPEFAPGPQEGHFGLLGMRERTRALNGAFTLTSSPGHGTQITISLPPSDATAT